MPLYHKKISVFLFTSERLQGIFKSRPYRSGPVFPSTLPICDCLTMYLAYLSVRDWLLFSLDIQPGHSAVYYTISPAWNLPLPKTTVVEKPYPSTANGLMTVKATCSAKSPYFSLCCHFKNNTSRKSFRFYTRGINNFPICIYFFSKSSAACNKINCFSHVAIQNAAILSCSWFFTWCSTISNLFWIFFCLFQTNLTADIFFFWYWFEEDCIYFPSSLIPLPSLKRR